MILMSDTTISFHTTPLAHHQFDREDKMASTLQRDRADILLCSTNVGVWEREVESVGEGAKIIHDQPSIDS